jgi:predicted DNA-binding protein (MmcQ/YjbR family)
LTVDRLRTLCPAFPDVEERSSHGEPSWFIRGSRQFAMFANRHHDDRVAFWCDAPSGALETLVSGAAARFFLRPYVGHRGWLGVHLDVPLDWSEIAAIVRDAHDAAAHRR